MLALAFIAGASPASAAVTLRGIVPEDGPRAGWLERYTEARQGPEQIDKVSQTYKVGDGAALDLSHLAGDIRVTGGTGSEIKIDATKRVRHRDPEQAKRLLEALRVDVNNFNGRVEVRTIYPRRGSFGNNISASVDYVISVPAGASVSRQVDLRRHQRHQRARAKCAPRPSAATSTSARRRTSRSPRPSPATSRAQNIGTQTTLVLSTVSGTVLGTGLKVRALEAGSVSGNVRLVGSEVERLEAKSVSGNIEFDAPLTKGGRYEFTSHSGNVRIVLSGNTGFELDADTFSGSVRSDVPVTLRAIGRTDQNRAAAATAPSAAPTATPARSCPSAATAGRSSLPRSSRRPLTPHCRPGM